MSTQRFFANGCRRSILIFFFFFVVRGFPVVLTSTASKRQTKERECGDRGCAVAEMGSGGGCGDVEVVAAGR